MTRSLFVLPALASATPFAKPRVLGLTGGIAAGKSTAREAFASLGVPCLDGDAVARGIHQEPTHPATHALALAFPNWMTPAGALQRGSLQGLFARDADANRTLIDILKPHVLAALNTWTVMQCAPYVIWESALLLRESIVVDRVLVVDAPVRMRVARLRSRNPSWSEQHIANILAMQATLPAADGVQADALHNDGSQEQLQAQVAALHQHYLQLWN
jgi:dephospho-CoA kinase